MQINYFTDSKITQIIRRQKCMTICDGYGLYLRFQKSGCCSWIFRYTNPNTKKRRLMGFGSYPTISIEEARSYRHEAKYLLLKGKDPLDERKKNSTSLTIGYIFSLWVEHKNKTTKKFDDMQRLMEKYLIEKIAKISIVNLTAAIVADILRSVEQEKGILVTIHKILMYFNQMMEYAVSYGYISSNPCSKLSNCFGNNVVKHMASIPVKDIKPLFKEIASSNINDVTLYLLVFNILTFVRPNEASNAKWSEFDLKKKYGSYLQLE